MRLLEDRTDRAGGSASAGSAPAGSAPAGKPTALQAALRLGLGPNRTLIFDSTIFF